MSKKKGRIITVNGCPCEMIETPYDGDSGYALMVAPDGALFVANIVPMSYGGAPYVSGFETPCSRDVEAHLRRLASELWR